MGLRFTFFILLSTSLLFRFHFVASQHVDESSRISELYELIPDKSQLYGKEVLIFDYKLKGKNTIKDSLLVARISVLHLTEEQKTIAYDTNKLEVIKYEILDNKKKPVQKLVHDSEMRVIESSVINESMEPLSKIFYTYQNGKLVSEETFTGYAYLDEPRKLSLITYVYNGDKLQEREKKYSLNGTHWIQTWITKYDESGNIIWQQETDDDVSTTSTNIYENGRMVKCKITISNDKPSIKQITYNKLGYPTSVHWFYEKKKKPIRLTKYFYKEN